MRPLLVLAVLGACGDNVEPPPTWATVGPDLALPLLADHDHSAEATIAAHGDDVVIAGINLQLPSADAFESTAGDTLDKRIALWTSHDRGASFAAPTQLDYAPWNSDPVVRAAADGTFWLGAIDAGPGEDDPILLARSTDHGATWPIVRDDLPGNDKDWIAIDDGDGSVYVCAAAALAHVASDGSLLDTYTYPSPPYGKNCTAAYVGDGFHFLDVQHEVQRWDGAGEPAVEVAHLSAGDAANVVTIASGALGPRDGGQWFVRGIRRGDDAAIVLDTTTPSGAVTERRLSADGATAFLPAATLDARGRLHVAWYDTSGDQGVLRYTRSATDDLSGAFLTPYVIDDDACPGARWYPYSTVDEPPGGRRLREYIDLAVDGDRTVLVWTHAPDAPARLHTTYVDEP